VFFQVFAIHLKYVVCRINVVLATISIHVELFKNSKDYMNPLSFECILFLFISNRGYTVKILSYLSFFNHGLRHVRVPNSVDISKI
jgi:hypothetical protein